MMAKIPATMANLINRFEEKGLLGRDIWTTSGVGTVTIGVVSPRWGTDNRVRPLLYLVVFLNSTILVLLLLL